MAINYSLEEEEIQKGYVLSCQARPTTEMFVSVSTSKDFKLSTMQINA